MQEKLLILFIIWLSWLLELFAVIVYDTMTQQCVVPIIHQAYRDIRAAFCHFTLVSSC